MEHIVVLDCGHEDITRVLKTIRKNVLYINQNENIITDTIKNNIMMKLKVLF